MQGFEKLIDLKEVKIKYLKGFENLAGSEQNVLFYHNNLITNKLYIFTPIMYS